MRARIVHAGVALSRTAMNADEWIRIRPGTYGAFALGIAHVLVREKLHDEAFVRDHAFGFEPWKGEDGVEHAGFADILRDYPPEKVAELCGVEAARIEKLARELAATRPSFAIAGLDELRAPNGLSAAMAVHALNGLLGAIDRPGGLLVQRPPPLEDWPGSEPDDVAAKSLAEPRIDGIGAGRYPLAQSVLDAIPGAILAGKPYPIDTLLLYYSNPVHSRPDPARWRKALGSVPWIVSFTPFLDETASEFADLVLPDATYLERHEDAAPAPSVGAAVFGLRQPCVAPLHETRATGDVVIELARGIGEPLDAAFPFKDFRDAMKKRFIGLWKAKRGSIVEESGSDFLKRLESVGWWSDESYPFGRYEEVFATPSGRFEFFSQSIRDALKGAGLDPAVLDRACMPRHDEIPWSGDSARYPCVLLLYKPNTYAEGSGANLPWLQELVLYTGRPTWTTEAEIHPDTAARDGIADGDAIEIESPIGRIVARAHVTEGILAGVVRVPQGGGHTAFGRFARGWGANPMHLVDPDAMDPLSGVPAHCATRVAIRKAHV